MFKRGGSSYEAQGTGITSPYDTPRRGLVQHPGGYAGITREEIKERRAALGEDPRSEMSYAAEGFGALASPYKERTGEAKTIGEMLYEGATAVRGSRAEGRRLEQGAELANIESDEAQILAQEAHAFKMAEVAKQNAAKGTYPDMHPGKLYDQRLGDWKRWLIANEGRAGHATVMANLSAFAAADIVIRNEILKAYDKGKRSIAEAVSPSAYDAEGIIERSKLSGGIVYFDPISKEWFTVSNPGTASAELIPANSYEEGWNNIGTPASKKEASDDLSVLPPPP